MIEFILGAIFGVGLLICVSVLGIDSPRVQEKVKKQYEALNPKKGYIAGLSDEEQSFKDSLKETEDTLIK